MALDSKELAQLAAMLGDVLAPRIREAVAENVSVRIEALAQTMQADNAKALADVQAAFVKSLEEQSFAIRRDFLEQVELTKSSAAQLVTEAQSAATSGFSIVETTLTAVDEKIDSLARTLGDSITAQVDAVRKAIPVVPPPPVIPAPTKLLVDGELSDEMRDAMAVAVKHVLQPIVDSALTPIIERASRIEAALPEAVAAAKQAIITDVDALLAGVSGAVASIAEATEKVKLETEARFGETDKAIVKAITAVESNTAELFNSVNDSVAVLDDKVLKQLAVVNHQIETEHKATAALVAEVSGATEQCAKHAKQAEATAGAAGEEVAALEQKVAAQLRAQRETAAEELLTSVNDVNALVTEAREVAAAAVDAAQAQLTKYVEGAVAVLDGKFGEQLTVSSRAAAEALSSAVSAIRTSQEESIKNSEGAIVALDNKFGDQLNASNQATAQALASSISDINMLVTETREFAGGVRASLDASLIAVRRELATAVDRLELLVEENATCAKGDTRKAEQALRETIEAQTSTVTKQFADIEASRTSEAALASEELEKNFAQIKAQVTEVSARVDLVVTHHAAESRLTGAAVDKRFEDTARSVNAAIESHVAKTSSTISSAVAALTDSTVAETGKLRTFVDQVAAKGGVLAEQVAANAELLQTVRDAVDGNQKSAEVSHNHLVKSIDGVRKSMLELDGVVMSLRGFVDTSNSKASKATQVLRAETTDKLVQLEVEFKRSSELSFKQFAEFATNSDDGVRTALETVREFAGGVRAALDAAVKAVRDEAAAYQLETCETADKNIAAVRAELDSRTEAVVKQVVDAMATVDEVIKSEHVSTESQFGKHSEELRSIVASVEGVARTVQQSTEQLAKQLSEQVDTRATALSDAHSRYVARTDAWAGDVSKSLEAINIHVVDQLKSISEDKDKALVESEQRLVEQINSVREFAGGFSPTLEAGIAGVQEQIATAVQLHAAAVQQINDEIVRAAAVAKQFTEATASGLVEEFTENLQTSNEKLVSLVSSKHTETLSASAKAIEAAAIAADESDSKVLAQLQQLEASITDIRESVAGVTVSTEAGFKAVRDEAEQLNLENARSVSKLLNEFADKAQSSVTELRKAIEARVDETAKQFDHNLEETSNLLIALRDESALAQTAAAEATAKAIADASATAAQAIQAVEQHLLNEVLPRHDLDLSKAAKTMNAETVGLVSDRLGELTAQITAVDGDVAASAATFAAALVEVKASVETLGGDTAKRAAGFSEAIKQVAESVTSIKTESLAAVESAVANIATALGDRVQLISQQSKESTADTGVQIEALSKYVEQVAASVLEVKQDSLDAVKSTDAAIRKDFDAREQSITKEIELANLSLEEKFGSIAVVVDSAVQSVRTEASDALAAANAEFYKQHRDDVESVLQQVKVVRESVHVVSEQSVERIAALQHALGEVFDAVPEHVRTAFAPIESTFVEIMNKTVEAQVVQLLDLVTPELEATARTAAIGAVPAAVQAQAEPLREAIAGPLVRAAADEATRIATEACDAAVGAANASAEGAVAIAKGEAATAATLAAMAATEALRGELLKALDPAARIAELMGVVVPREVRAVVADTMADVEPRVELRLTARLQAAIDRIPVPRDGRDGRDAKDGRDGLDGKNAKVMPPVPYEYSKLYEAGAWAVHANGIWVAGRTTDVEPTADCADWDCVVSGVKAVETVLQEDGRTIELHMAMSNGEFTKSVITLPIPILRDTYDATREYAEHDMVTYDGSQWAARRRGKGLLPRPGTDFDAWRLVVKHGKDGKDLKQPAPQVIRHFGEWELGKEYPVNVTVDHAGVRWLSMKSTRERPPFTTLVSNEIWTKLGA